jgi:hypothetical protein
MQPALAFPQIPKAQRTLTWPLRLVYSYHYNTALKNKTDSLT